MPVPPPPPCPPPPPPPCCARAVCGSITAIRRQAARTTAAWGFSRRGLPLTRPNDGVPLTGRTSFEIFRFNSGFNSLGQMPRPVRLDRAKIARPDRKPKRLDTAKRPWDARARHRLFSRDVARHAGRTRRDLFRAGRSHRARARHPVERPGPRDQLRADRRRSLGAAASGLPLCPSRHKSGQERQRAWRCALDAYGRQRALPGGADGAVQGPRDCRPLAAGRCGRGEPQCRALHRRRQRARHRPAGAGGSGPRPGQLGRRDDPGLDADAYNDSDVFAFPNGCHAAEVEIDPKPGR